MQTLILPDFPPPWLSRCLSVNGRAHWSDKAAARKQVAVHLIDAFSHHPWQPVTGKARLTIRWVFPEQRKRDTDNHTGGGVTKCVIDHLVRRGLLPADDSAHLELAPVEIVVERGQRRMELFLEDLESAGE